MRIVSVHTLTSKNFILIYAYSRVNQILDFCDVFSNIKNVRKLFFVRKVLTKQFWNDFWNEFWNDLKKAERVLSFKDFCWNEFYIDLLKEQKEVIALFTSKNKNNDVILVTLSAKFYRNVQKFLFENLFRHF